MEARRLTTTLSIVGLLALGSGCAGPDLGVSASVPTATDLAPASHLGGAWHGTYGSVGGDLYEAEARVDLQIRDDGTFTATVTPNRGANNLAKPSTWSGTIVDRGRHVTLRNAQGPWPWLTLVRSGNLLYGVAADPTSQTNVMLNLRRDAGQP